MALQMPTNITPDVLSGFGGGVFNAASGLTVSWQVNGTPYMTAYRVVICENDAESTQVYTTGKVTLQTPFYGVSPTGEINMFSFTISAAALAGAGIVNGNEYKMYITQWWGDTNAESVTQQSASVIQAKATPDLFIVGFDYPITSRSYEFSGAFMSGQGDGIVWARWVLYNAGNGNVVADTENVYGTSLLRFSYDAFFTGTLYEIELTVCTQSGQIITTGKQSIAVSYQIAEGTNVLTAEQECNWNGISVTWTPSAESGVTGYAVYRLDTGNGEYTKLASLPADSNKLIDYSAKNGHTYTYQLWTEGAGTFVQTPIESNPVSPCRWNFLLIAASLKDDGAYHPSNVYVLSCNVELSDDSNNSKSSYEDTFAGYPAYQQSSNRYRSGRITAFIGQINPKTNEYLGDTADYVDELMALTTSGQELFIRDRKGNFRNIRINGAITAQLQNAWPNQATAITIPWVEVASATSTNVVLTKGDELWPYDEVADTTIEIDVETGMLVWTTPDGYVSNVSGSRLALNARGHLVQTLTSNVVQMADLTIDQREHVICDQ